VKTYHDAHGRFRQPTDEERWPDPEVRALRLRTRALFGVAHHAWLMSMKDRPRDVEFLRGLVWSDHA